MSTGHIVASYDEELAQLHRTITHMGRLASTQLSRALKATLERDGDLAAAVMADDAQVDALEQQIENQTLKLLALRAPVGRDLREVVAALKIANNLERIGDFAANVAKRSLALNQMPEVELTRSLRRIGDAANDMLTQVVTAYADGDAAAALAVREADNEVDLAYTALFRELLTYMMEAPQRITACTHLMFAAKNLERIGDHATNIAETLCFQVLGQAPDAERAKGDDTALTILTPPA
ncbi:phosphate signaling complex protein PhoU [Nitrospirillum viridazoti]|uniref:Phosphate-specific transport system accessory protein PhoU n=1 Tax=Nitrospirillum viridazoti CBAmc TaxID=1441467 RepID=A0A248JN02_9PROT|nr:phosphate signaling complex protein PhoU [Nitrospirillum amazonense]ASG20087.1 phosphate transport system regulatory protein PhoU [Nitrospirillum amazonense CBAmc]TWB36213.1 phosphate transport system protein [Nitrospirillum amazonense]